MKTNYLWILTTLIALVIGVGGYNVLATRGLVPVLPALVQTTEVHVPETADTPDTTPPPVTTPAPSNPPTTPAPTVKSYLDVKEVYDTVVAPPIRSDEPRSGTKEITVRGKLRVIKAEIMCVKAPCPQPDSSEYRFELIDYYEKHYSISVRQTGDPVARNLTDGQTYTILGTLNYSFSTTGTPTFTFDPARVLN